MKKAQIKMGETIAVLFVFFILLVFGLIFYANMKKTDIEATIAEKDSLKSVEITQTISFLSEFFCTEMNVRKDGCFDVLKVQAFTDKLLADDIMRDEVYFEKFGYANINIRQLYRANPTFFTNGTDANSSIITVYNKVPKPPYSSLFSAIPIILYKAGEDEKYEIGVLEVEVYT